MTCGYGTIDPEDYIQVQESLDLSPAMDQVCVTINIELDQAVENQESFLVQLTSSDSLVNLTTSSAEVFINDSTSKQLSKLV